jgi:hypothetical protein
LVLAFWLLTSSGSFLGNGLILGILVHFAIDRMQKALYDKRSWPPPSPTPSGN